MGGLFRDETKKDVAQNHKLGKLDPAFSIVIGVFVFLFTKSIGISGAVCLLVFAADLQQYQGAILFVDKSICIKACLLISIIIFVLSLIGVIP